MTTEFDIYNVIEPNAGLANFDEGFRATVADPLWFLCRQWQLGEHHGEDAGSPVRVEFRAGTAPFSDSELGEQAVHIPTEAIVEASVSQWWTVGRRIRIGRLIANRAIDEAVDLPLNNTDYQIGPQAQPYDQIRPNSLDGRALAENRATLGIPDDWFPAGSLNSVSDSWLPSKFEHETARISAGAVPLRIGRHVGGEINWYSFTAESAPRSISSENRTTVPTRVRYPGAPNPRWWEIESTATDIGYYSPDRSHFASLLLIEIVTRHSDNWFSFPVDVKLAGVTSVNSVRVTDVFGDVYPINTADDWNLYKTDGLTNTQQVFALAALNPITGQTIDVAHFVIDEQANLAWATEVTTSGLDGVGTTAVLDRSAPERTLDPTRQQSFNYLPGLAIPTGWHPYLLDSTTNRLVQGRLANLSEDPPSLAPEPKSPLLFDPAIAEGQSPHQVWPWAVPVRGLEISSRYRLTRSTAGDPILWLERKATPRPGWVSEQIRHDELKPAATRE